MSRANYMREIYVGGLSEGVMPLTTSYAKLEQEAKAKLPPPAYGYVAGSASSEKTYRNNLQAFDQWEIVPRMLAGVELDFVGEVHMGVSGRVLSVLKRKFVVQ